MENHLNLGAVGILTVEGASPISVCLRGFGNFDVVSGQMRVPYIDVIDVVDDETDVVKALCWAEFVLGATV